MRWQLGIPLIVVEGTGRACEASYRAGLEEVVKDVAEKKLGRGGEVDESKIGSPAVKRSLTHSSNLYSSISMSQEGRQIKRLLDAGIEHNSWSASQRLGHLEIRSHQSSWSVVRES